MAFPANAADLEVCIAYGANLASDLTTLTYSGNLATTLVQPRVLITRGRIGGASRTQPTTIDLGLKNPNGIFSPRNIVGPNYGRLRRNTPIRVRLDPGTGMVTRAIGYMPDWPIRWTGPDIDDHIPMQASGALRRLGTGQDAKSAMQRTIAALAPSDYWPLEDGTLAGVAGSAVTGGTSMVASGTVNFSTTDGPPGSGRLPGSMLSRVGQLTGAGRTSGTPDWFVGFSFRATTPGVGEAATGCLINFAVPGHGAYARFQVMWRLAGSGILTLYGINSSGTSSSGLTGSNLPELSYDTWYSVLVGGWTSGGNTNYNMWVNGAPDSFGPTVAAHSNGASGAHNITVSPTTEQLNLSQPLAPVALGHVFAVGALGSPTTLAMGTSVAQKQYAAMNGYSGELAATRVARLCTEDGVAVSVAAGFTEPMGVQLAGTLPGLLRECEDSDAATLIERRTGVLGFDPIAIRYNISVAMTIPYLSVADLQPDDGDRDLRNYVTVQRIGGSSATNQRVVGPLGTDPATGVDRYPDTVSRSLALDSQAPHHASWIVKMSTVDEPRYVIGLNLRAHPELVTQWLACDIGSRIQVTNPPAGQVGPAPVDVIIEGYEEMLDGVEWYVVIHALPYRPYEVVQIQSGTGNRSRIAAGVSTTDLAYSATATSLSVTSATTRWIDSATYPTKFPIVIEIAGEAMTCTSITGTGLTQTFAVTRGLHDVTKALPITSQVQIWRAAAISL